jgi:transposase
MWRMAMGTRQSEQGSLWVATAELPKSPGHPFYTRLNTLLDAADFDRFAEGQCARFYAPVMGRPSLAPGRYFRLLLVGYFEGIDSERGIAWRCPDALDLPYRASTPPTSPGWTRVRVRSFPAVPHV